MKISKTQKIVSIVIILILLYLLVFFIAKNVGVNFAKKELMTRGYCRSSDVKISLSVNPITIWAGRVKSVDFYTKELNSKDYGVFNDVKVNAKGIVLNKKEGLKSVKSVAFSGFLSETELANLIANRMKKDYQYNIKAQNGKIYINVTYPRQIEFIGSLILYNNALWINFEKNAMYADNDINPLINFNNNERVKGLNISKFEYVKGYYNIEGFIKFD